MAFHDSPTYDEHEYLAHRRANLTSLDRRCAAIFGRIGRFVALSSLRGQRMLDVGCDTGQLLDSARRQFGIVPVGVDVAGLAVDRARASNVEAYQCALEEAPGSLADFAVITAIDVIEHVPAPHAFFRALFDRLRPGGVAYVETPNVGSAVYRVGRALSAFTGGRPSAPIARLFPPEHIQYFSPEGLAHVAEVSGLRVATQDSRVLPRAEIAVASATQQALGVLQSVDYLSGQKLLRWAILRRPSARADENNWGNH